MNTIDIYRSASVILSPAIDQGTTLFKSLNGDDYITATFSLDSYTEILVGDYITFRSAIYKVRQNPDIKKVSESEYQYSIRFDGSVNELLDAICLLDGDMEFYLTGTAEDFVDLIVSNLNRVHGTGSYSTGSVDSTDYKVLLFNGENCLQVLQRVCEEFDLEFSFSGTSPISIALTETIGNATGLSFEYKNGLYNIKRTKVNNKHVITRLYPYGSEKNLGSDYADRRTRTPLGLKLRLDYTTYPDNYIEQNVATYGLKEATKEFPDIYPRFTGTVDSTSDSQHVVDASIDFDLNSYLIEGLTAKIVFLTGDLSGYEFEIISFNNATKEVNFKTYTDEQGGTWPSGTVIPAVGDQFTFVDIKMPPAYIAAAEAELLSEATAYLTEVSSPSVVYEIEVDWHALKAGSTVLDIGDIITITDAELAAGGVGLRIVEFTQQLDNSYKYTVKISDNILVSYFAKAASDKNQLQNSIKTAKYATLLRTSGDLARLNRDDLDFEDGATVGADFNTNVVNKPTTLADINVTEGNKLTDIEENATAGADFNTNVTNKPTSLAHINLDEGEKLSGVEDGATAGANYNTNVTNKPTALADINLTEGNKLTGVEEGATQGADFNVNLANKPTALAHINSAEALKLTGIEEGATVGATSEQGAKLDELYTTIGLSALTASEVNQLENIGAVTISNTQWGYLGALNQPLTQASAVTFATVNTGQGANELYAMNQPVRTTDGVTFATVNTGQGANELYAMNQPVRTTDSPTFATLTLTGNLNASGTGSFGGALSATSLNTGYGANELHPMNQAVRTTDNVTFATVNTGHGANELYPMNQAVRTTDSPTFSGLTISNSATVGVDIGSPVYSSGFAGSGWRYDASEDQLTLDNLTVRKQMRVYELLIEQIRANRGAIVVSPGNAKIINVSGTTAVIDNGNDNRFPISLAVNDIIRCQRWNGTEAKYYLASVDSVSEYSFTFTIIDGTDTIEKGDEVVVVGNSSNTARQGLVYITSSDDNAPYIDILDGVTDGDFTGHQKVRLGKLTGITDAAVGGALSGYGLYSDNVYLKGTIVASSGSIGGWTITSSQIHKDNDIILDATNKRISLNDSTFGNRGIQLDYGGGYPKAYIGNGADTFMKFDGFFLTWKAANTELDASGNLIATSATLSGSVTANDGAIGGWDITTDGIQRIDGNDYLYISNAEGVGTVNYGRGITMLKATAGNPVGSIKIVRLGQLADLNTNYDMSSDYGFEVIKRTATSTYEHLVRIGGSTAVLGGWNIDTDAIYHGTKKVTDGFSTDGITLDAAGAIHAERFYINSDGSMGLRSSESGKRIQINSTDNNIEFYKAGIATPVVTIDDGIYGGGAGIAIDEDSGTDSKIANLTAGILIMFKNADYSYLRTEELMMLKGTTQRFNVNMEGASLLFNLKGLPTSSAGLGTGDVYQSGGYLRIV